jgi:hypothetical protein
VHENPKGSQEVNAITTRVKNDIKILQEFLDVFLEELFGLPLEREVDNAIELTPGVAPISYVPY